jgi:hypothetical protein
MTDRIHPERAVVAPIDCDRFDTLLADYLENALPSAARAQADAHLAACDRCRALTDDLLAITRDAAGLGPIEPPRDLWAGIATRIEAPVVPIGRTGEQPIAAPVVATDVQPLRVERTTTRQQPAARDRFLTSRRWLAAAASVLVATSVGATYTVMRVAGNGGTSAATVAATTTPAPRTDPVAQTVAAPVAPAAAAPSQQLAAVDTTAPRARAERRAAESGQAGQAGDARLVAEGVAAAYAPGLQTYDREIATLRAALRQRADLDTATVAVLERSLRVIDQAITESRRALAGDPGSRLLGDQLTRALEQKVELLRTAVLLPSRS